MQLLNLHGTNTLFINPPREKDALIRSTILEEPKRTFIFCRAYDNLEPTSVWL